jgi:hypothetical protein
MRIVHLGTFVHDFVALSVARRPYARKQISPERSMFGEQIGRSNDVAVRRVIPALGGEPK